MEFNDTATQLSELLACMSTADTDSRTDLATGLDAFFLIFAGALVLYVGNYLYIYIYIYYIYWLLLLMSLFCFMIDMEEHNATLSLKLTYFFFFPLLLLIILLLTALCKLVLPCFAPDPSVPKMPRMVRTLMSLSVVYIMEYPQHH